MNADEHDEMLERMLDQTLTALPLRPAPATLEARVLGELQRRAALPWWRRSFAHWPLPARAAFIALCAVSIGLALWGAAAAADVVLSLAWAREAGILLITGANLAASLSHAALPAWLYGVIAVIALLYAFLFGLGAAVYRTLYLQPSSGR
jgi:hypothetical protein